MTQRLYDYTVIEDNGGGLHLFLFRPGTDDVVAEFGDFEYQEPGALVACLDALDAGEDIDYWEGARDGAQESWDRTCKPERGNDWIVTQDNAGERVVHTDRMGRAGQREFGIVAE